MVWPPRRFPIRFILHLGVLAVLGSNSAFCDAFDFEVPVEWEIELKKEAPATRLWQLKSIGIQPEISATVMTATSTEAVEKFKAKFLASYLADLPQKQTEFPEASKFPTDWKAVAYEYSSKGVPSSIVIAETHNKDGAAVAAIIVPSKYDGGPQHILTLLAGVKTGHPGVVAKEVNPDKPAEEKRLTVESFIIKYDPSVWRIGKVNKQSKFTAVPMNGFDPKDAHVITAVFAEQPVDTAAIIDTLLSNIPKDQKKPVSMPQELRIPPGWKTMVYEYQIRNHPVYHFLAERIPAEGTAVLSITASKKHLGEAGYKIERLLAGISK